jgi:amino-acid N-acetyltransferase
LASIPAGEETAARGDFLLQKVAFVNIGPEAAQPRDLPDVLSLLETAGLPQDGVAEHFGHFMVCRDDGRVVGAVGIERHGDAGLLRSLVVHPASRGKGVGVALTEYALQVARHAGLGRLYLLTETAQAFFPRFGFQPIDRNQADAAVRQSVEFTTACPQSALCMALDLDTPGRSSLERQDKGAPNPQHRNKP